MSNAGRGKKIETGGFPKALKKGTGLKLKKDLSHKVSAKQTDTMFQTVKRNPVSVKKVLPAVVKATNMTGLSTATKRKVENAMQYLQSHAQYGSTPMSPRSTQAAFDLFNTFANKNSHNLRPRPDTENRSIGQYPHFNFDNSGSLSPRSKHGQSLVTEFEGQYGSFLTPQEKRETRAYVDIEQHAKKQKTTFRTEDQTRYAEEMRKK